MAIAAPPDPRKRTLVFSLLGLVFFLAWQALILRSFIATETRPPAWDQAGHMEAAWDLRQASLPAPLYERSLSAVLGAADPLGAALWLNWLYLAVFAAALFGLAFYFRPDASALPCALIVLCAPGLQEILYAQRPDLAVAALTAASYLALVRSEEFRRPAWSLGFGLLAVLGLLHQAGFAVYMLPAFYVWLKALGGGKSRSWAAACGALVLVFWGPWFWARRGQFFAALLQAGNYFSGMTWQEGSFFWSLFELAAALGPPFWLMSLLGLLLPQFHRAGARGWLMTTWFVASAFIRLVLPGYQPRLLMPAVGGLAVAGMGAWPVPMIWGLAVFQFLGAANYPQGWISRLSLPAPFQEVVFFVNEPAIREDWKLEEILREARRRHHPSEHPAARLVVVADHPRFNARNISWTAKRSGFERLGVVGVNGRLCEFSEFVLLKTGKLGPKERAKKLAAAVETVATAQGWFSKGYEEIGRWPLPDGSAAVLYQQRRLSSAPVAQASYRFQHYETAGFLASDLRLELGAFDKEKGSYRSALLTAAKVKAFGLDFGAVSVEMTGLAFVPLPGMDDLRFLRLEELKISRLSLSAESIGRFLESRFSGLQLDTVEPAGPALLAAGRLYGLAVSAEAAVELTSEAVRIDVKRARLGPLSVAEPLRGWRRPFLLPLEATEERPFRLRLDGMRLADSFLSVP